MNRTVFFSWQSDRPSREGRNLIEKALEIAIQRIASDMNIEEAARDGLILDRDTKDVPGSPSIFDTILNKIDQAAVFVADLTFCGSRSNGKPTPNPNVLIEYGWALKSLSQYQVVAVMNEAYGQVEPQTMPFDLAHMRFPITYNLSTDAPDGERRSVKEQLAKEFERALRMVLESREFKAKLPKEPEPLPFPQHASLGGKGRFRQPGKPLGIIEDPVANLLGRPTAKEVYLADGPTMWLRVMPAYNTGQRWLTQQLKDASLKLAMLPLMQLPDRGSIGFVRHEDGCGRYPVWDAEPIRSTTYSVAYVFHTGEIWIINAWLTKIENWLPLNESHFIRTLDECALFLDFLGCSRPYQWIVGMEGMLGRQLIIDQTHRTFGHCMSALIEESGTYGKEASAAILLKRFFERVFDYCGARRPD